MSWITHLATCTLAPLLRRGPNLRGRGYIARQLHAREGKSSPSHREWTFRLKTGYQVCLPSNSIQTWSTLFTGDYDADGIHFLAQFITPHSIVLDIGGCYGLYSLGLAAQTRQQDVQIFTFEPLPANLKYLEKNIQLNTLTKTIELWPFGLGAEKSHFKMSSAEGASGNSYVVDEKNIPDFAGDLIDIQIQQLDSCLEVQEKIKGRRCSLMKLDIEGFELHALNGAREFIRTHRPIIYGEFSVFWLQHYGFDPSRDILKWAQENNYEVYEMISETVSWLSDRKAFRLEKLQSAQRRSQDLVLKPI